VVSGCSPFIVPAGLSFRSALGRGPGYMVGSRQRL